jgi:hypothetical protein
LIVKEEVGVVVLGLLVLVMVMAKLVPPTVTGVLRLTIIAVVLNNEQVELILDEQVDVLVNEI